jgi:predicted permease
MRRRKRMLNDLDQDIRDHIDRETQDNIERGMSPDEARHAALRKFGNVRRVREDSRAVWMRRWLEELVQDLRYGLRMLRKSPGFSAVAILTLALGIGANTAIFSLVNAVMLQSLPVRNPEQLVVPRWHAHQSPSNIDIGSYGDCAGNKKAAGEEGGCAFSVPMLKELRNRTDLFSSVSAFAGPASLDVNGNGAASIASGELVSGSYFQTLGVGAAMGRTLELADDLTGAVPVVVLNYTYWKSAFGGAQNVIGRTIRLNGVVFEIVGVADPSFTRLAPGKSLDMWLPLAQVLPIGVHWSLGEDEARNWWLTLIARLAPGMSRSRAEAATNVLYRNQTVTIPKPLFRDADEPRVTLMPAQEGLAGFRATLDDPLKLLMAAVGIVLLISCANIAGLLLARGASRQREVAVRLALGAGRGRVIRQLLTESVLLSLCGAALGILIAFWSARALAAFFAVNSYSPVLPDLRPDAKVLAFTAALALLTGIAFGSAPAFFGSRVNVSPALRNNVSGALCAVRGSRGRFGLGSALVIAQVALSVVMMIGAGLLLRTLEKLRSINPGFDPNNLVLFTLNPSLAGYKPTAITTLYEQLRGRLVALPGVTSVTYSSDALLVGSLHTSGQYLEGMKADDYLEVQMMGAGPDYFKTMHIPLLSGREFTAKDMDASQHAILVNEACARHFPGSHNVLGLHVGKGKDRREVVGVVADTKYDDMRKEDAPTAYMPLNDGGATFALRTAIVPQAAMASVKQIVNEADENLPLVKLRTQSQAIDRLLFNERLVARLSSLFGILALVLTCLGLYGLLAYEVSRRAREIGIRMALGAQQADVLRNVVTRGAALTFTGAALGILAAAGVTRYIGSMLYGVEPVDALTFVCVGALLTAVALAACWVPARRATRVDPMVALRYE